MKDGTTYIVTDEIGKFYICGNTQFKKSNPNIIKVEEIVEQDGTGSATQCEMSFGDKVFENGGFADLTAFNGFGNE